MVLIELLSLKLISGVSLMLSLFLCCIALIVYCIFAESKLKKANMRYNELKDQYDKLVNEGG